MNFPASNSQSYDVFLADVPGFDDSEGDGYDADVIIGIADWLGFMRKIGIKLSGIIYLHRITDDRVGGVARLSLQMLQDLVGEDRMENLLFVSTRWEEVRTVFF